MNWEEFYLARLHLAEERVGSGHRADQRAEMSADEQTRDILRARGMVSNGV